MRFDIITIFPGMFDNVFSGGVLNKAIKRGLLEFRVHDLRDFTNGKHRQVDDRPFGGSPGMVLKPEPVFAAVEKVKQKKSCSVILLSPQGKKFDFRMAKEMANYSQVILICGRYEGVDERAVKHLINREISIGDYILTGGELAAMVVVDSVSRYIPEVVGKQASVEHDSFSEGFFDFPQYTRPRDYKGMRVPQVLFSGNHKEIEYWRKKKSLQKTWENRPDLLDNLELSSEDQKILDEIIIENKGNNYEPN